MGGPRRRQATVPHLRVRVRPSVVAYWRSAGWHVHRVGQAAYIHSPDDAHHLILGVWARQDPRPAWALRLGRASDGYLRRERRAWREQRWRRLARDDAGRWLGLMQWWRWPFPRVYRWEP